jgi:hypothetical protein
MIRRKPSGKRFSSTQTSTAGASPATTTPDRSRSSSSGGLASKRQEVTVTLESVASSQTNVFVETQARARYGAKQLFDWGQGNRVASALIDALKSNRQAPASD